MKVFISYGDVGDQVSALRLQALGAVHGLTVYVPPVWLRKDTQGNPADVDSDRALRHADAVLGLISANVTSACLQELALASTQGKGLLVLAPPSVPVLQQFEAHIVEVDAADPNAAAGRMEQRLAGLDATDSEKAALRALGTIALGLSLLSAAAGD